MIVNSVAEQVSGATTTCPRHWAPDGKLWSVEEMLSEGASCRRKHSGVGRFSRGRADEKRLDLQGIEKVCDVV